MITAKISAGSSSIVQDIIDMCQNLHQPLSDWQGFFYKSMVGSQQWCVWAMRMDETAQKLQYVYSSGLAAPPAAYELITVSMPTLTGFALSFTQVNAMPSVVESEKGSAGGVRVNSIPTITFRMSAAGSSALSDYISFVTATSLAVKKYYYISTTGNQPWAVYAFDYFFGTNGVNPCIILIIMSGMASPTAGSETLAIAAPSTTTLNSNSYTALTGPLSISSS